MLSIVINLYKETQTMITNQQYRRLKLFMNKCKTIINTADKAGMSEKTARKYLKSNKLPEECKKEHNWQTKEDTFSLAWERIKEMLELNSGLEAKTIFEFLQREEPGKYMDSQLRTLQRRIKNWRVTDGPSKEVFFDQIHYPGVLCASDFMDLSDLDIIIAGELFKHLLYHFVLTYSNWEWGTICYSESFESLSYGLQSSLWELGGVPLRHRTDRLSAAVNKECNPEIFTERYKALLNHYKLEGAKTNAASANENGDIEQRNNRFKRALDQSLMIRSSREFWNKEEYAIFLINLLRQLNSGRKQRLLEEIPLLKQLPNTRLECSIPYYVPVGQGSTIKVRHNTYSVPSRLIGSIIEARVYGEHIEIWYGKKKIDRLPRLYGSGKCRINYRHIIDWLVRKPGAFENYRYREELFPSSYFRKAYDYLKEKHTVLTANKEYLKILELSAKEGETLVENTLKDLVLNREEITFDVVSNKIRQGIQYEPIQEVKVNEVDLNIFDELFDATEGVAINESIC